MMISLALGRNDDVFAAYILGANNMSLSIRDPTTDKLVRALTKRKGREIVAHGPTGKRADKAFFDEMSGDL